jgi:hypothetical protein
MNIPNARCIAAVATLLLAVMAGRAEAADISKLGSWTVGHNLSLAAMLYAQESPQQNIDASLAKAKKAAEAIRVPIKPFPPKGKTRVDTMSAVIQYLIKGDGWSTGEAIFKKFGREHATLFEIAVKTNLGLVMYQPDDDHGIANVLKKRAEEIKFPPELWTPTVTAMTQKRPQKEVQTVIAKMHEDVASMLLKHVTDFAPL